MRLDLTKKIESSFLSCEKDTQTILKRLFIEYSEYAEKLIRLLVINTKDCLDLSKYNDIVKEYNVARLIEEGYIRTTPKIKLEEHNEVKSYILVSFDNFTPSGNPQFRDNTVSFDVICHSDYWNVEDFRLRPIQIMGYIDGLLNDSKLSGIGTLQFLGANELILSEVLSGYSLHFLAVHGSDDRIPGGDI